MGFLAARAAYRAPSHTAQRLFAIAGKTGAIKLWPNRGCDLAGRRSYKIGGGGRKKVVGRRSGHREIGSSVHRKLPRLPNFQRTKRGSPGTSDCQRLPNRKTAF